MMARVEETSPPGVSSCITSAEAFSCLALWIACEIWRVVATPMTPFTSVTKTRPGDCAFAGRATAVAMHSSTKPANHVDQTCPIEQARHVKHSGMAPLTSRPPVTRAQVRTYWVQHQYMSAGAASERPRCRYWGW